MRLFYSTHTRPYTRILTNSFYRITDIPDDINRCFEITVETGATEEIILLYVIIEYFYEHNIMIDTIIIENSQPKCKLKNIPKYGSMELILRGSGIFTITSTDTVSIHEISIDDPRITGVNLNISHHVRIRNEFNIPVYRLSNRAKSARK